MARIIVGADENAGDIAARLLELADHQNDVQTRTDGPALAYEVPDKVYEAYVGGKADKRPVDEQRANAEDQAAAQRVAADPDQLVGDELPEGAAVVEPGQGDDLSAAIVGDELPETAVNADPPANGEFPSDGQGGDPADADPVDDPVVEEPKPRKRAARKTTAAKSTPAPAGDDK